MTEIEVVAIARKTRDREIREYQKKGYHVEVTGLYVGDDLELIPLITFDENEREED